MPPTAVSKTDQIEKKLSPHSVGINPPTVEPIAIKIQMRDFELI
jgi:hypothetical protein